MTCICGLIDDGKIWMAGDRAAVSGDRRWHCKRPKVFRNGPMLIGVSGSVRTGDLLQHALPMTLSDTHVNGDVERFLVTEFMDAVRKTLKAYGNAKKDDDQERIDDSVFLVGIKGRLFEVYADYQVLEVADPFTAIGSGAPYALGALHATVREPYPKEEPSYRLLRALQTAAHYCPGVAGPFDILSLES